MSSFQDNDPKPSSDSSLEPSQYNGLTMPGSNWIKESFTPYELCIEYLSCKNLQDAFETISSSLSKKQIKSLFKLVSNPNKKMQIDNELANGDHEMGFFSEYIQESGAFFMTDKSVKLHNISESFDNLTVEIHTDGFFSNTVNITLQFDSDSLIHNNIVWGLVEELVNKFEGDFKGLAENYSHDNEDGIIANKDAITLCAAPAMISDEEIEILSEAELTPLESDDYNFLLSEQRDFQDTTSNLEDEFDEDLAEYIADDSSGLNEFLEGVELAENDDFPRIINFNEIIVRQEEWDPIATIKNQILYELSSQDPLFRNESVPYALKFFTSSAATIKDIFKKFDIHINTEQLALLLEKIAPSKSTIANLEINNLFEENIRVDTYLNSYLISNEFRHAIEFHFSNPLTEMYRFVFSTSDMRYGDDLSGLFTVFFPSMPQNQEPLWHMADEMMSLFNFAPESFPKFNHFPIAIAGDPQYWLLGKYEEPGIALQTKTLEKENN